ncbi:hypothetical protein [Ancylobacter dichloromethanicus]|uniref:hypothetical protein n=1 Tax=Ancylobacter dichloromethanicus TaxID=518825 RepID=UPI00361809A0
MPTPDILLRSPSPGHFEFVAPPRIPRPADAPRAKQKSFHSSHRASKRQFHHARIPLEYHKTRKNTESCTISAQFNNFSARIAAHFFARAREKTTANAKEYLSRFGTHSTLSATVQEPERFPYTSIDVLLHRDIDRHDPANASRSEAC